MAVSTTHDQQPALARRAFRAYELPAVLGLSRPFVTKLIASGALVSFTVGRCRFVTAGDLDSWLEAQRAASTTAGR